MRNKKTKITNYHFNYFLENRKSETSQRLLASLCIPHLLSSRDKNDDLLLDNKLVCDMW